MENINCLQCEFRHPDNGNCTGVGGFCTAVPAAHCPLLRQYLGTRMTPEQVANAKTIIESAFAEDTSKAERIRKLLAADKEGRCIILPCKLGDTVYMIERIFDIDNGVCDEICARKVIGHGGNNLNQLWLIGSGGICNDYIFVSEFGKTVFLTREEAERAIQEMEGKKDG